MSSQQTALFALVAKAEHGTVTSRHRGMPQTGGDTFTTKMCVVVRWDKFTLSQCHISDAAIREAADAGTVWARR